MLNILLSNTIGTSFPNCQGSNTGRCSSSPWAQREDTGLALPLGFVALAVRISDKVHPFRKSNACPVQKVTRSLHCH